MGVLVIADAPSGASKRPPGMVLFGLVPLRAGTSAKVLGARLPARAVCRISLASLGARLCAGWAGKAIDAVGEVAADAVQGCGRAACSTWSGADGMSAGDVSAVWLVGDCIPADSVRKSVMTNDGAICENGGELADGAVGGLGACGRTWTAKGGNSGGESCDGVPRPSL